MDKKEQDAMLAELAELRAELEELRAQQAAAAEESDEDDDSAVRKAMNKTAGDISAELQEMVEAVDKELKDTNPVTLLVIFALGAFVGRLLPK